MSPRKVESGLLRPRPIPDMNCVVINNQTHRHEHDKIGPDPIDFGSGLVGYLVYPDPLTTLSKNLIEPDWVGSRISVNRASLGPSREPDNESPRSAEQLLEAGILSWGSSKQI